MRTEFLPDCHYEPTAHNEEPKHMSIQTRAGAGFIDLWLGERQHALVLGNFGGRNCYLPLDPACIYSIPFAHMLRSSQIFVFNSYYHHEDSSSFHVVFRPFICPLACII